MDLGPVIQSELSQKENNKFDYQHIYVECRKMAQMNLFAGRNRDADVENGWVDTGWELMSCEIRTDVCSLPCAMQRASGNLLRSSGSSAQRSLMT